jgi:PD-(D/E)XK endonuclease
MQYTGLSIEPETPNKCSSGFRLTVLRMRTVLQGNAAEAAVLQAFAGAGFYVLVPFGGGLPFDLGVVMPGGEFLRIQVKTGRVRRRCVEFNSASTDHGRGQQHYRGRADLIAVHVPTLDQVFVLPVDDCPISRGCLRLEPARNNQQRGVRRADEYSFEAWVASVP